MEKSSTAKPVAGEAKKEDPTLISPSMKSGATPSVKAVDSSTKNEQPSTLSAKPMLSTTKRPSTDANNAPTSTAKKIKVDETRKNPIAATASQPNNSSSSAASVQKPYATKTSQPRLTGAKPAAAPSTSSLLVSNYADLEKTIYNLMGLLQTYGALTLGQLEYNLPPVPQKNPQQWSVRDVLEILVALQLVQKVQNSDNNNNNTDQYCCFGGVPRGDVVLPKDLPEELDAAIEQAQHSWQRTKMLRAALLDPNMSHKVVLKQLLQEFPDIVDDPVYLTALKGSHIDVSRVGKKNDDAKPNKAAKAAPKTVSTTKAATTAGTLPNKTKTAATKQGAAATKPAPKSTTEAAPTLVTVVASTVSTKPVSAAAETADAKAAPCQFSTLERMSGN